MKECKIKNNKVPFLTEYTSIETKSERSRDIKRDRVRQRDRERKYSTLAKRMVKHLLNYSNLH